MHHLTKPLKDCRNVNYLEKVDHLPSSPMMGKNFTSGTKTYLHWRHVLCVFSEMGFNNYPGIFNSAVPQPVSGSLGVMCEVKKAKTQGTTARRAAIHSWKYSDVPILAYSSQGADLSSGTLSVCILKRSHMRITSGDHSKYLKWFRSGVLGMVL